MITGMETSGVDHEALLETYIRAINIITRERPRDLTISLHMCRGNYTVRCVLYRDYRSWNSVVNFEGRCTLLRRGL